MFNHRNDVFYTVIELRVDTIEGPNKNRDIVLADLAHRQTFLCEVVIMNIRKKYLHVRGKLVKSSQNLRGQMCKARAMYIVQYIFCKIHIVLQNNIQTYKMLYCDTILATKANNLCITRQQDMDLWC